MCTQTKNEIRDIKELLNEDSYQEMSDEEIDLIIEYKIRRALTQQENLVKLTAEVNVMEETAQIMSDATSRALSMLESIVSMEYHDTPIEQPRIFTPRSLEV